MTKTEFLKPFTMTTHIFIWAVYLLWITVINVQKYGTEQLVLVLLSFVLMLIISYLNRYLLRMLLFHPFSSKRAVIALLPFVVLMAIVYLWLYHSSSQLAIRLLPERSDYGFVDFAVDFTNFYWSFGWKGICLGLLEIMANLLRRLIHILTIQRQLDMQGEVLTAKERYIQHQETMRRWVGHFLGNIAQSARQSKLYAIAPDKTIPVLNDLWSYGMQVIVRQEVRFVPITAELDGLRQLDSLYRDRNIRVQWPEKQVDKLIVPMTLMAPYKNMVQHGDFGEGVAAACFDIEIASDRLVLRTDNAIAEHAAWIYEQGGTGLEQMERVLQQYGQGDAHIAHRICNGRFKLQLTIYFPDSVHKTN